MKIYTIIFRHGTVTQTMNISASNAKRAKKYAAKRANWPGANIYKMQRVF